MNKKVAVVTKNDYKEVLTGYIDFEVDNYYLTDSKEKKIVKSDITLDYSLLDDYDFVILIGSECTKAIAKVSSVLKYQGYLLDDKYLPLTNPRMLKFQPAGAGAFEKAIGNIKKYINGDIKVNGDLKRILYQNEGDITELLLRILNEDIKFLAMDTETSALYARDGWVLGISLTWEANIGYYINTDFITDEHVDLLQKICNKLRIIFHNAKFDIHMLEYHFNLKFPHFEDTMLLHYALDEANPHGLKDLSIKYTELGEYEKDLDDFKRAYCKKHGIKISEFTYDLIPFETLGIYGAMDTIATFELFTLFYPRVHASKNIWKVYSELLIPGTKALIIMENNGVPFSKEQLIIEKEILDNNIKELENMIYEFDVIHEFEEKTGNLFNSNSTYHKREVLFDMLKLKGIGKKTDTGMLSTDAEVMEDLASQHGLPKLMLDISKAKKIKNTYIDKILLAIDSDSRLRTGFHLHTTTSGRLSSSGKMNMQTLPRDNKAPKRCIKARDGWSIVSGD